jgi:xanthine dehydrogenase accessory factor
MIPHPLNGEVHQTLLRLIDEGRRCALVTILDSAGSIPRRAGTKAIVDSDGALWGTIGGGLLEAEAQRHAVQAILAQRPLLFDFCFSGSSARHDEPICGGRVRVLIDPLTAMHRAVYEQAVQALERHQRGILLTTVQHQEVPELQVQWLPRGALPLRDGAPINEAVRAALETRQPVYFAENVEENREGLAEPLLPTPLLLIAGGGHVGQALARQAYLIGFRVALFDDRAEFTEAGLYPSEVITRSGASADFFNEFPVTEDTYIAIVGRGHRADMAALSLCIDRPAAYIGLMGSRRKIALVRKEFIEGGLATAERFDQIFAPIGLDIDAQTVPEIAASIIAQLIAVRRGAAKL